MNLDKFLRVFIWIIIIIDLIIIIPLITFLISKYTNIDLVIVPLILALVSVLLGIIALYIAIKSGKVAEKSKERMDTIGDAEIQQCIINIEGVRKEYFYGLQEHLFTPTANKTPINLSHLQQINIFTTWLHFQNIKKALIYKEYMTDTQQLKFFRLHRTLLEIVLDKWQYHMVSNESINQLLTGVTELYDNLEDTHHFEARYYNLLKDYVGLKEPNEEFLDYITRKKREVKQRGFYDLFEPFQ